MRFQLVGFVAVILVGIVGTTSADAQESALAGAQVRAKAVPSSPEVALGRGVALRRAGHEAEALVELRRALLVSGNQADVTARIDWEIARTHLARRDFGSALSTCRAMAPRASAASHVCAAEAHLLWRRGTEAQTELAELPKGTEPSLDVRYAARVVLGRVRELEAREGDAEAAYQEAIALAPDRAEAHVLLGTMLRRTGKDGLSSLRKAVEIDAHDPVAQLELGRALPAGSAESLSALERAIAERPTYTDALRAVTEGYVAAKRLPEAKRSAEAVLKVAPADVFSHVVAGRVALAEGKIEKAVEEGETASKLMPNAAAAKLLVADACAHKGEIDLAVEAYQAAFGLDHSDPTPLVNAANACTAAGRTTTAKAFARRATQDFPQHVPAWMALGDALAADKDPAAARTAYEAAKRLQDGSRPIVD